MKISPTLLLSLTGLVACAPRGNDAVVKTSPVLQPENAGALTYSNDPLFQLGIASYRGHPLPIGIATIEEQRAVELGRRLRHPDKHPLEDLFDDFSDLGMSTHRIIEYRRQNE